MTRPNSWYSAADWRSRASDAVDSHLAHIAARPHPNPPPARTVRVEALTATWCVAGQPVEPGETYTVAEHEADMLVLRGKAKRV